MEYKICEEDFDKYIEINGKRNLESPISMGLKDKTAKYYVIYENGEFYDDFAIYLDDNNFISLDQRYFFKDDLMEELEKFLKLYYKSIRLYVNLDKINLLEVIKRRFHNVKIETVIKSGYDFNKVIIML